MSFLFSVLLQLRFSPPLPSSHVCAFLRLFPLSQWRRTNRPICGHSVILIRCHCRVLPEVPDGGLLACSVMSTNTTQVYHAWAAQANQAPPKPVILAPVSSAPVVSVSSTSTVSVHVAEPVAVTAPSDIVVCFL
jgi:hypothetical protein